MKEGISDPEIFSQRPYGGKEMFYSNLELQFPILPSAKLDGVLFFDLGDAQDTLNWKNMRMSLGVGLRWMAPMLGLIHFYLGAPLKPQSKLGENSIEYQFTIRPNF